MNTLGPLTLPIKQGQLAVAGSGVGASESGLRLDPETLKQLEIKSLDKNVSFDQVLELSKNGQDPEAIIELLSETVGKTGETSKKVATGHQGAEIDEVEKKHYEQKYKTDNEKVKISEGEPSLKEAQKSVIPFENNELSKALNIKEKNSQFDARAEGDFKKTFAGTENLKNEIPKKALTLASLMGIVPAEGEKNKSHSKERNILSEKPEIPQLEKQLYRTKIKENNSLNLSDFIAKQSPTLQKSAAEKAYKPISESMFSHKLEKSLAGVSKTPNGEMKLQDLIYGDVEVDSADQVGLRTDKQLTQQRGNQAIFGAKVFDINQIQNSQTIDDVISKIQDYIIQTKHGYKSEVQASFEHQQLGKIDLILQKNEHGKINISVQTHSAEASDFFRQNQSGLLSKLAHSGVQVGDFKLDSSQSGQNQGSSQDSSKQQFSQSSKDQGQHNSRSGERDQDSRRREELWNQFREKEVA